MSIAKSQAALLKTGLLNYLGKSKSELKGKTFDVAAALQAEGVLKTFATQVISLLQKNLQDTKANASFNQYQSIDFTTKVSGDIVTLKIDMGTDYWEFLDKGVKGDVTTYPESKDSPFQYRDKAPPVAAIEPWISFKGIPVNRGKGKKDTLQQRKSLAFVIAQSIRRKGTRATNFYSSVINSESLRAMEDTLAKQIGSAVLITIVE